MTTKSGGKFRARRLWRDAGRFFQCVRCYQRVPTGEIETFEGRPSCAACRAGIETGRRLAGKGESILPD